MEKKAYINPLMEVETISMGNCILSGSPTDPHPQPPLGPGLSPVRHRWTDVF